MQCMDFGSDPVDTSDGVVVSQFIGHQTSSSPSSPPLDSHVAYLYFNPPRMASAKQAMNKDTISPSPSVCVRATAPSRSLRPLRRSRVLEPSGSRPQGLNTNTLSFPHSLASSLSLWDCEPASDTRPPLELTRWTIHQRYMLQYKSSEGTTRFSGFIAASCYFG